MEKTCVFCGKTIAADAETYNSMVGECCSEDCRHSQRCRELEAVSFAIAEMKNIIINDQDPEQLYDSVKEHFGKAIADAMLNGKRNRPNVEKHVIRVEVDKKVTINVYSNGTIVLERDEVKLMKLTIDGILKAIGSKEDDD